MQPTHATSDMYWAEDRVGPERIKGAYAWRTVLNSGARIALGSDFPVEDVNPFFGIYAAVTRQDQKGWPAGGWHPQERVTIDQALSPPSGLSCAIFSPRSPAKRRANGSLKIASGRSVSCAR